MKSLGDLGQLSPRDRFTAAKREAEIFAELVETGGAARDKSKQSPSHVRLMRKTGTMRRASQFQLDWLERALGEEDFGL
jgi:hypothetical protein